MADMSDGNGVVLLGRASWNEGSDYRSYSCEINGAFV
jgi:hypothetical protein